MNNEFRIKNMIADDILYQVEQQTKENLKIYYANISQENKQLKSILTELEEWLNAYKSVGYEDIGTFQVVLNKIQELKENYRKESDKIE